MSTGIKNGVTYYSGLKNIRSITTPVIDNESRMGYKGHFDQNWDCYDLDFDNFGYGLKKTRSNQGLIYCPDASKLFSLTRGYVGMVISLPYNIYNGIYWPLLKSNAEIDEHLLWGVNPGKIDCSIPTISVALTVNGLEFTIWSSYCKYTLINNVTSIHAGESTFMEFIWDNNGLSAYANTEGYKPTMCIRMDEEDILLGNPPIANNSISGYPFYVLDTPFKYSNLECTIRRLVTGNEVPQIIASDWYSSSSSSSSGVEFVKILFDNLNLLDILANSNIYAAQYSSVNVTDSSLQLSDEERSFSHLWIPNSNLGTMSYLDVSTVDSPVERGVYLTGSDYPNPSRTAVTANGDCWVANRNKGTVIKLGNIELGNCRNDCLNTSIGPSDIKSYGSDDAVLLEFSTQTKKVALPGTQLTNTNGIRGLTEDANQHIWVNKASFLTEDTWYEIIGDGGCGGSGVVVERTGTGAGSSYGAVCSLSNNYIWSVNDRSRAVNLFSADDPSINYTMDQFLDDGMAGTYGIAYSRGYIYCANFQINGYIYRINVDVVNDFSNFWNYVATFRIPKAGLSPRHYAVYVRNDSEVDVDRTEDIYISYYSGSANGGIAVIKNHKQYADGTITIFPDPMGGEPSDRDIYVSATSPIGAGQAGIGIMRDVGEKPYAWILSGSSDKVAAWDIEEEEWNTFEDGSSVFVFGGQHYNYTNFTGTVDEVDIVPLYGSARYIIDSKSNGSQWRKITSNGTVSPGINSLQFEVAASSSPTEFPSPITVQDGVEFYLVGRYLEFTVIFQRSSITDPSPLLSDFEVEVGIK